AGTGTTGVGLVAATAVGATLSAAGAVGCGVMAATGFGVVALTGFTGSAVSLLTSVLLPTLSAFSDTMTPRGGWFGGGAALRASRMAPPASACSASANTNAITQ